MTIYLINIYNKLLKWYKLVFRVIFYILLYLNINSHQKEDDNLCYLKLLYVKLNYEELTKIALV